MTMLQNIDAMPSWLWFGCVLAVTFVAFMAKRST